MSDKISEKMARKVFSLGSSPTEWTCQKEDRFVDNLRACGLIKPSKLDEARSWCKKRKKEPFYSHWGEGYRDGISETEEKYELAITEILEERK
ncbi:MAG: hypothetical protein WC455_16690 [Dehalococcoidia bacterium]|jgi:hypothetical protein